MRDFWKQLFDPNIFVPHIHCFLWNPGLIRLHVLTDIAIGLAYVAISVTLGTLIWRARKDMPFSWIVVAFGVFILACGATHFMEVWTLWSPLYWLSGIVKGVTAIASVTTAILLPFLVPRALALVHSGKVSVERKADLEAAILELVREINERKQRELKIQELNTQMERMVANQSAELATANQGINRMSAILDNSVEAIVSLDLNYLITGWNCAAELMFGYRAAEVLGSPVSILSPEDRSSETQNAIESYKRGVGPSLFETVRVRKDGERIDVNEMIFLIRNGVGKIQGTSLIKRDITQRKHADEMLRLVVDAAPNAMVMVDDIGKIVLVNSETERLFGYNRSELLGRKVEALVPHRYQSRHPGQRAEFMEHPRARPSGAGRDLYGLRKDGTEFPVEIGLNPIRMAGATWVLSAIVDVTERRRATRKIHELNQELERRVEERTMALTAANSDLESFSYTVAHDLRAPLRHIAGFASILAEEHAGSLNEEGRGYLRIVQNGAQEMGVLIDKLLHLARVGRQPLSRRPTRLNDLVNTAREQLVLETVGRQIDWRVGDLGIADCDTGLMQQVFTNLLSNAVKYTRNAQTPVIEVSLTTADHEKVFVVRDNGAGFEMQYAGKLFGVFQRLHKTKDFEGTGVGLATVQRIIHKHGGRIWADAAVNKGATFSFTLPDSNTLNSPAERGV
jgi:PAS domain S-box-containing protein